MEKFQKLPYDDWCGVNYGEYHKVQLYIEELTIIYTVNIDSTMIVEMNNYCNFNHNVTSG